MFLLKIWMANIRSSWFCYFGEYRHVYPTHFPPITARESNPTDRALLYIYDNETVVTTLFPKFHAPCVSQSRPSCGRFIGIIVMEYFVLKFLAIFAGNLWKWWAPLTDVWILRDRLRLLGVGQVFLGRKYARNITTDEIVLTIYYSLSRGKAGIGFLLVGVCSWERIKCWLLAQAKEYILCVESQNIVRFWILPCSLYSHIWVEKGILSLTVSGVSGLGVLRVRRPTQSEETFRQNLFTNLLVVVYIVCLM